LEPYHPHLRNAHHVLSLAGLIASKRAAGRKKDVDAVIELESLLDLRKRIGL
jgi:hypothetical protein